MAIDDNTSYELTGYQVKDLAQKIRAKADSSSLASVATSGLYSDLTGAPTIPTVYNGTLTIQQNGTTLGTFSANQSANETINITGGGGTSATIFYLDDDFGLAPHIYTDSGHTTYATAADINNALDAGPVIISDGSYSAEITAFNKTGGLANTGQWEFVYSPDAYVFSFVDNTNIVWDTLAYQPLLTAGTGINISANNVISATGGGTTVVYTLDGLTDGNYANGLLKDSNNTRVKAYDIYTHIRNGDTVRLVYGVEEAYTVTSIYMNGDDDLYVEFDSPIQKKKFYRALIMTENHSSQPDILQSSTTEYSVFTGATSSVAGSTGIVPAPAAGDQEKVLHGDGTWKDTTAKLVEMSYGESNAWTKFIAAYNAGSIVYCRASSNANPATGSQTRKAFMAYVNNAANPTNVEFQYVRSVSSKTSSQPVDQVFVYTLTNTNGGTWSVASRNMAPKIEAGAGISVSYSNGTYTISLASADDQGGASD